MVLPLGILNEAQGRPMLVELKDGETLNGHLVTCDSWMNIILKEVVKTSADGDKFWRLPEVYVRGNHIKYLRVPDDVVEQAKAKQQQHHHQQHHHGSGGFRAGGAGGRGGGFQRGGDFHGSGGRGGRGGYGGGYRGARGRGGGGGGGARGGRGA